MDRAIETKKRVIERGYSLKAAGLLCAVVAVCFAVTGCKTTMPKARGEGTAVLTWNAPRDSSDTLGGYVIYYGKSVNRADTAIRVPVDSPDLSCAKIDNPDDPGTGRTECTYTVTDLDDGTHYFAVKAYDKSGVESDFSNQASK